MAYKGWERAYGGKIFQRLGDTMACSNRLNRASQSLSKARKASKD